MYNPDPDGSDQLPSESNLLGLSTGDLTPTLGSSSPVPEISTPEPDPPTQWLAGHFGPTYDELLGGHFYNDEWEVNPILHPDLDPSLAGGF